MQHDLVRMSGSHTRVAFGPVVRYCVGEDISGSVKSSCSDGTWGWVEGYLV